MKRWLTTLVIVAQTVCLLPAGPAHADDVRKSVVKVFSTKSPPNMFRPWEITPPQEVTGSGVIIEGGRVLTSAHVVSWSQQIYVQPNESSEKLDATVEYIAEDCDLAILTIDDEDAIKDIKPVPLAEKLPPPKTKVNVLGYPVGGDTLSVTEGVVSRIEWTNYNYGTAALRIQVDAAINPGNSGGPAIVQDAVAGIVFSRFPEGENIGYLIPAEVVRHFIDDFKTDGKYDGFPKIDVRTATLENPSLRSYLNIERQQTGVVVHRVDQPDLKEKIKPWDIISACDGVEIDNLGVVPIAEDIRVEWGYLISKKAPGSTVKLKLIRQGKPAEVEVATITKDNGIIQRMTRTRPTYFLYGGLVFSPATAELVSVIPPRYVAMLGSRGSLLFKRADEDRVEPGDEIVVACSGILPHRITKGYGISPLSVLTHVNDQPVKSLRHAIELIKAGKDKDYVVFRFEEENEAKIVLEPKLVEKFTPDILRNNNIPSDRSEDLKDVWP
ncbi:MAG TPA: trypsin-like peptidase domain-containing protein [Phycisphaerae bacterium]|nr:trypsin-like peptidase domain-containing protein [Phycisphaerae bacterium]HRR87527.1 trypsin-like peptidase domain-containing protein [Phycisphaerae bacterium]